MIGFDNLFILLRPAAPADSDFAYQVKKIALDVCFVNPSPVFLLDKAGDCSHS